MRLGVIEGLLPIDNLKLGRDDGTEIAQMKSLLRRLGELGVPMVCYNFMAGTDWIRTSVDAPERGGAKVTAFDIAQLATARIPGRATFRADLEPGATRAQLWTNLEAFLDELLPIAEDAGWCWRCTPTTRRCRRCSATIGSCTASRASSGSSRSHHLRPTRSPSAKARSPRWVSTSRR